jgi:hypothetical protein
MPSANPQNTALQQLADVDVSGAVNGNPLVYNAALGIFQTTSTLSGTVLHRYDTDSNLSAVVLGAGEIAVASDMRRIRLGDGATAGGSVPGARVLFYQLSAGSTTVAGQAPTEETISKDSAGVLNPWVIPANTFQKNGDMLLVEMWLTLKSNANAKSIGLYVGQNGTNFTPDNSLGMDLWCGNTDASSPNLTNTNTAVPATIHTKLYIRRTTSSIFQYYAVHDLAYNVTGLQPFAGLLTYTGNNFALSSSLRLTANSTVGSSGEVSVKAASGIFYPYT